MTTKYDWSDVPEDTNFIATDSNGYAHGWSGKPRVFRGDGNWNSKVHTISLFMLSPKSNTYRGDWKDSLEQRPK
ncbi:hypothetical protein [Acinetobacter proteolyticus]|uniref:hypothetical protein n=1 Tax=Acinetobacter proteolyticus TaxID=1776741 RepID=UPI003D97E76D